MGDAIISHSTTAPVPGQSELKPPALKVDASNASSEASMNAITNAAENKNTMNQIAGSVGGGGGGKGGRMRRTRTRSRRHRTKCTCKCKCKGCCLTRRLNKHRSLRAVLNKSQRRIVSRRIQMNLLHRKIRKNKNANYQSQSGGGDNVPQHGTSCASSAEQNCPGNSSAALLEANRQATMNAQGDQLE